MSENPISISNINDFIFCPASIYFHLMEGGTEKLTYQGESQLNGTAAHERSDAGAYSTKKSMLQAVSVYCERYNIVGKIDTFDTTSGILTERKKKISTVYDGYVFQVYAQYFALCELGYTVSEIRLYSIDDNKVYKIAKPENDAVMLGKFENVIKAMNTFDLKNFKQDNALKCQNCIYEPLCSFSICKE